MTAGCIHLVRFPLRAAFARPVPFVPVPVPVPIDVVAVSRYPTVEFPTVHADVSAGAPAKLDTKLMLN